MIDEQKEYLDNAVEYVLQQLRELECDGDDLSNSMEQNLEYIITQVMERIYSSNVTDRTTMLGILSTVQMKWYLTHFANNK
jgi:hypothetical protein